MKANSFTLASISALAITFASAHAAPTGVDHNVLINRPVDTFGSGELAYQPIDVQEIEKTEKNTIAQMSSTKCCSSGTCDSPLLMNFFEDLCNFQHACHF